MTDEDSFRSTLDALLSDEFDKMVVRSVLFFRRCNLDVRRVAALHIAAVTLFYGATPSSNDAEVAALVDKYVAQLKSVPAPMIAVVGASTEILLEADFGASVQRFHVAREETASVH